MESCISPDFDNLSPGSFGVLTEQREQYQGKKYYRYRIRCHIMQPSDTRLQNSAMLHFNIYCIFPVSVSHY
jgi:hypothetical protein